MSECVTQHVALEDTKAVKANKEQLAYFRANLADMCDKFIPRDAQVARQQILDIMDYTEKGTLWILIPVKEDSEEILSALWLFDVDVYLCFPGSRCQTIRGIYAGSANTPTKYRNNGYATKLYKELLVKNYQPKIGQYIACAWWSLADSIFSKAAKITPGIITNFNLKTFTHAPELTVGKIDYFRAADLNAIAEADGDLIQEELCNYSSKHNTVSLAFAPDADCLEYRYTKSKVGLQVALQSFVPPEDNYQTCGAQIGAPGSPHWAFIVFRLDSANAPIEQNTISISRARFNSHEQLYALLYASAEMAKKWRVPNVQWRTDIRNANAIEKIGLKYEARGVNDATPMSSLIYGGDETDSNPKFGLPHDFVFTEVYAVS